MKYRLLDCGDQKKVELLGDYKVIRPCPQAVWPIVEPAFWTGAHSEFVRTTKEKGEWKPVTIPDGKKRKHVGMGVPAEWEIESQNGLQWKIAPNDFGNIGVFTEHWTYADELDGWFDTNEPVLNLFTYSGSSCVNLVKSGYRVTAVDSSKNAMETYTYNLGLNGLSREGQRLILEDCHKFVAREGRRGNTYGSIMIDAPSYGRGTKGELFVIEDDLTKLLLATKELMHEKTKLVLTQHSPRFTPASLTILCQQLFPGRTVESHEILNPCESGVSLPSGFLVKIY